MAVQSIPLAAAEQKQNDAQDVVIAMRNTIAGIQAKTLAGLIFKARYAPVMSRANMIPR
jgi:hypothetical protein